MNFKFKYFTKHLFALLFFVSSLAFSQNVPSSQRTPNTNCWDCVPNSDWTKPLGTPDVSSATIAAATSSQATGQAWIGAPLPLPPNNHERWITMRDLGSSAAEEIIQTTITNLVVGREYELLIYTSTFRTSGNYSPAFNDRFDYLLEGAPSRVTVPSITQNVWGTSRLRFTATNASRTIRFFPGFNGAGATAYESVNLSLSLNAINTVPVALADNTSTNQNTPISFSVIANDSDAHGGILDISSVDLNPSTPALDATFTNAQGTWTVSNIGVVTFAPLATFTGVASIPYTIRDNYVLDNVSRPATSNPATISVTVLANNTDTDGDGIPDRLDLDDDNDGILDIDEGMCNQIPNTLSDALLDSFDNVLNNPVVNNNNIQTANPYNGWTAANVTTGALLANPFNIIRVDGTGYAFGPDFAHSGSQYLDINGNNAMIYKQFNVTENSSISASAWFANRATADAGYTTSYTTRIEILRLVNGVYQTFTGSQGNLLTFTKAMGDEGWFNSSLSNVTLIPGTYRITMYVADYGHVDSITYCLSKDTDGDGFPNHLDTDSDADGCPDAVEGSEAVRITQVYPLNFATVARRGQIRVRADGVTAGTPAEVISTVAGANGVPQLVNNTAGNPAGVGAGVADNTDTPTATSEIGQGIGTSQNNLVQDPDCTRCFRPATTPGVGGLATSHGITALARTNNTAVAEWPGKIKGAYTVLDAKTKGFVVNRLTTAQINAISTANNAVKGMAAYDTDVNCLKIYDGTAWSCYNKQTCDNFNQ